MTLPIRSVTLAGSATDDGLPAARARLLVEVASGPGIVTFANSHSAAATASFDAPGAYVLQLTASDGALSGSDSVSVVVSAAAAGGRRLGLDRVASGRRPNQPARSNVVGSVASTELLGWRLEHRHYGARRWTGLRLGETPVSNGALGQLDPSMMMNGVHEVRLTATDNAGRVGAGNDERRGARQPQGRALHGLVRGPGGAGGRPAASA